MITAVIIDDSKTSHDIITNIVKNNFNNIDIIDNAFDVKSGIFVIKKNNPDIVFLDVEMPDGTGFDLLKNLSTHNFKLIFITAHQEYAINAIKFSALDYLLKPLDDDEICLAIKTAVNKIKKDEEQLKIKTFIENHENNNQQKIVLKTSNNVFVLTVSDIIRCESDNNYTVFYTNNNEKIMVSQTLKQYDNMLAKYNFIRIHKSHLVNTKYIKQYSKKNAGYLLLADNTKVPVSVRKRDIVLNTLKNINN